jgi:hypothetical protein
MLSVRRARLRAWARAWVDRGSDIGTLGRTWTIWDLAILVLGLNIWISFLLLPVLHLDKPGPTLGVTSLVSIAPISLLLGVYYRHRAVLLAIYPVMLMIPALATPQLVGVNVYTPWTFCLVGLSFLAYLLGTPLLLGIIDAPAVPTAGRDLEKFPQTRKWRRRLRIYRWLAVLSVIFPAVLLFALYLHPDVEATLVNSYPGRHGEARTLYGILILGLWLGVFYAYFLGPLKAHSRGDPQIRYELQELRRQSLRRQPRPSFYIFVTLALALMLVLLLVHW